MTVLDPHARTSVPWSDAAEAKLSAEAFKDEITRFLEAANRADLFAGQYIYGIVRMSPGAAERRDVPVSLRHDELYGSEPSHLACILAAVAFEGACLDVSLRRAGRDIEHKIVTITGPNH